MKAARVLWMVVDRNRSPINGCTGLSKERADAECADLNVAARHPEFGPFRVVEDVVATADTDDDEPAQRYLVTIREPRRGDRYWIEGTIRTARGDGTVTDEEDEHPVIVTDANELQLLTLAIQMHDVLRDMAETIGPEGGLQLSDYDVNNLRALVRRFDQWEP